MTRSEAVLGARSTPENDPIFAAVKRANVGATIELEAQRRRQDYARETASRREVLCDCSAAIERLEAALFVVYRMVDDVDDLAREALERLDAA